MSRCLTFLNYLRINKPGKSYGLPALELTVPYCAIDLVKNSYRNIECDSAGGLSSDYRVEGVGAGDCAPGSDHHHTGALSVHIRPAAWGSGVTIARQQARRVRIGLNSSSWIVAKMTA